MDNLTHTLISALVGDAVHRSVPASPVLGDRTRRTLAVTVMAVGGNLPDADVLWTGWGTSTLAYLLHHRGHTHTVVGALVLSLLLAVAVRFWWRRRGVEPRPADVRFLVGLALLGPLLHIALDFTNSYGVHPFWPADDRWFYGDSVFIVEPLLWACAAPLLFTSSSRVARVAVGLALAAGVGLGWFSGMVPVLFAALLTLLVLGMAALGRVAPRAAVYTGVAAWLAITAVFVTTGRAARADVGAVLADAFPTARTLDTVLTPMPADPVCREVIVVQVDGDRYVARSGVHSLAPALVPADRCAAMSRGAPTAPLVPVPSTSTDEMVWAGEISLPATLPATLAHDHCAVRALLQFARVPWAARRGEGWVVGDLRYSGFAEVTVGPGADACPPVGAPWVPPRQDLLEGPAA